MKILNAVEQEQFESSPAFNSVQRKQYFDFSSELLTLAQRRVDYPKNYLERDLGAELFQADGFPATYRA
jgi:hypothetical protein